MTSLQTQLEQSRLRETELLGALKEMQDKVLDLEKVRHWGENRDHRVRRVQYLQALVLDGNLMYMMSSFPSSGRCEESIKVLPLFLIDLRQHNGMKSGFLES